MRDLLVVVIFQHWTPYVQECVEAIEALDDGTFELLLVPDVAIPQYRGAATVVVQPGLIPVKRNVALRVCPPTTGWVAFIDSDCRPREGWLSSFRRRAELLAAATDVVAITGPNVTPPEDTWAQQVCGLAIESRLTMGSGAFRYVSGGVARETTNAGTCNLFVRREALAAVGGFDETLVASEDVKLCADLVRRGGKILFDPAVGVYHHRRGPVNFLRQVFNEGLTLKRYREFRLAGFPAQYLPSAVLAAEALLACVPLLGPPLVLLGETAAFSAFVVDRLAAGAGPVRSVGAALAMSGFLKAYGLGGLVGWVIPGDVHVSSREDGAPRAVYVADGAPRRARSQR